MQRLQVHWPTFLSRLFSLLRSFFSAFKVRSASPLATKLIALSMLYVPTSSAVCRKLQQSPPLWKYFSRPI